MTTALIGHTGFVGGTLCRERRYDLLVNRENLDALRGPRFEHVVCAGLPAAKWIANRDPEADRANVERLQDALASVTADRFTLISTIDVYPVTVGHDEDFDCAALASRAYGTNRLSFERFVRARFPNSTIVRLPALFGPGLKKNVIYDLLHDNHVEAINPESAFQWYPTRRLQADLDLVERAGVRLVNLFTEPLRTRALLERYFPGRRTGVTPGPIVTYDLRTKHASLFGRADGYVMGRAEVMEEFGSYLRAQDKRL